MCRCCRSLLAVLFASVSAAAAAGLADPTRPPDYAALPQPVEVPREVMDWQVSAIKITPDSRIAILNDQRVVAGDAVGPARVLAIEPGAVVLDYEGRELRVPLLRKNVKRAVGAVKE